MRVKTLLDQLRGDYRRHGSDWRNPSLWTLGVYRFGRWTRASDSKLVRYAGSKAYGVMSVGVRVLTGDWLEMNATIGERFHIIHSGSIRIHPDVVIGDRCGVMHNVTIGTNMERAGAPRLGDDVFIGVNATVLGNIRIGNRVRIGANTAVSTNVPDDCMAVGSPARIYPNLPIFAQMAKKDAAR